MVYTCEISATRVPEIEVDTLAGIEVPLPSFQLLKVHPLSTEGIGIDPSSDPSTYHPFIDVRSTE